MRHFHFEVDAESLKKRLDVFLTESQSEISRSRLQKLIEERHVLVNGLPARANYRLKPSDRVELNIPAPEPAGLAPEPIPLNILFEDDHMVVVDKPAGMVVHPSPGHSQGTLVNALLSHCAHLSGIGGIERPGIVHRLDKDTSGLILAAKTEQAHQSLARQFKDRKIEKIYLALVRGRVRSKSGVINADLGRHPVDRKKMSTNAKKGRDAETMYEVLAVRENFSYLRLLPKTGRTHQIRVHLASIGHPILGDSLYGGTSDRKTFEIKRHALHAFQLKWTHPVSGKTLSFQSPLPEDMQAILNIAEKPRKI